MAATKKPSRIPKEDLTGSGKEAMARRARHMQQFSPYGHKGGPRLSPEECENWYKKGAAASAESKKRRKTLASLMQSLLDQPAATEMMKICGITDMFPEISPAEITYGMLLTMSVLGRGVSTGRADQYTVIRDTIGEKPKDNIALTGGDGEPINPPSVTVLFNKGTDDKDD